MVSPIPSSLKATFAFEADPGVSGLSRLPGMRQRFDRGSGRDAGRKYTLGLPCPRPGEVQDMARRRGCLDACWGHCQPTTSPLH
jgi:hypothetical protein